MSVARVGNLPRVAPRPASPYVGLVPYDEDDAEFFFGRSLEVAIIAANLRASRLTVLYGPSGVGKSSLLMAGVVHGLRTEADSALEDRRFAVCVVDSWLDDPIGRVTDTTRGALQMLAGDEPLTTPRESLVESLRAWTERSGPLLLVLDQFEEYFRYHPEEGAGDQLSGFAAELALIVNDPDLAVNVLVSIREDAWPKLDIFEGHIPVVFENYIRVDHLDVDAAREAIVGPITAWNRTLAPGTETYEVNSTLVDAVIEAACGRSMLAAEADTVPDEMTVGDRIEAPFLQLVLERLWRATVADGAHSLTRERLDSLGGARRIVENHVNEALARIPERDPASGARERDIASDSFRFLVSSDRTKIAQRATDLATWTRRAESQVTAVLEKLSSGESRILRGVVGSAANEAHTGAYELFHDVLAEPILAWRRRHEAARQRRAARERLARVGGVLLALVAVFAGLSVWALIEQGRADTLYHQQQAVNRSLQARVDFLTKRKQAATAGATAQTAEVARLSAENLALNADTRRLQSARAGLGQQITGLRAENRSVGRQISGLNTENTAVATTINALNATYKRLATQLDPLKAQHATLLTDAGIVRVAAQAASAQLKAVDGENAGLEVKVVALGLPFAIVASKSVTAPPKPPPNPHRAAATLFPIAGGPAASNALRREIDALEAQLARLLQQRARLANETRWLRQDNALLARERTALRREVAQLSQTVLGLEAQHSDLEQTLANAEAEHTLLVSMATSGQARNSRTRAPIEAQRLANAKLQAQIDRSITHIGSLQSQVSEAQTLTSKLLTELTPPVNKLIAAAEDPSQAPSLAGLLAVEAYRVSPFSPDDPAHPGVYNALWIALSRLDLSEALALIAPTGNPSQKIGTTQSALIVAKICSVVMVGFTRGQWRAFLPRGAPYLARPC
jgi:hypothetical protein